MNLPNTEPLRVVASDGGRVVALPQSVATGVTASLSKWGLMQGGMTADQAEAELARRTAAKE